MDSSYVLHNRAEDFADFYFQFEVDRQDAISDPGDLLSSSGNDWDEDLYDYIEAFIRSGGTRPNIEKRHEVYKRRFLEILKT